MPGQPKKKNMIIMGIDPGSTRIGYGLIKKNKGLELVSYGTIDIKRGKSEKIISEAASAIADIIKKYRPSLIGIEKIYFSKNVKTGIEVSQTRGALILEISRREIPIKELSPSEIKLAVTGYGLADKKSVAKMAAKILRIEALAGFDDASDALAVAITASQKQEWGA